MKIVALHAENVKRLKAVHITPDGNVVEIAGRNGQGKTSVLDSIWWALAGAGNVQTAPVRKGEEEARVALDLGDLLVVRTFRMKDDGATTTSLRVENAEGARYPSPQAMLDALVGELSFDPLEFVRLRPREQYDRLRRFVPGVDFDELDVANANDYEARRDLNRRAQELRHQADGIEAPDDPTDDDPVDEDDIAARIAEASDHNAEVERQRSLRARDEHTATDHDEQAVRLSAEADELRRRAEEMDGQAVDHRQRAERIRAELAAADPVPDPVDVRELNAALARAREHNRAVEASRRHRELLDAAAEAEADAERLTNLMADREQQKRDAIQAADMPVEGLGFGEGEITLAGVPFSQASDAEQLEASVGIAMASDPELRVVRVRDGSLLDRDAMTHLAELADRHDCQVWIERVEPTGDTAILIEDGMVAEPADA